MKMKINIKESFVISADSLSDIYHATYYDRAIHLVRLPVIQQWISQGHDESSYVRVAKRKAYEFLRHGQL